MSNEQHGQVIVANTTITCPCISPNPIDVLLHIDPLYHAVTHKTCVSSPPDYCGIVSRPVTLCTMCVPMCIPLVA